MMNREWHRAVFHAGVVAITAFHITVQALLYLVKFSSGMNLRQLYMRICLY